MCVQLRPVAYPPKGPSCTCFAPSVIPKQTEGMLRTLQGYAQTVVCTDSSGTHIPGAQLTQRSVLPATSIGARVVATTSAAAAY